MTVENLHLHPSSRLKLFLAKIRLAQIEPEDICPTSEIELLYSLFPDLRGDKTAIGPGDDGNCQSWKGDKNWWNKLIYQTHQRN